MPKQAGGGSIMRGGRGEARGGRARGVGRGRGGRGTLPRSGSYGGEPEKRTSPRRGGPVRCSGKRGRGYHVTRSEHVDSVVHTTRQVIADKSCDVKTADTKLDNLESVASTQETGQKLPGGSKRGKKRVKSNYKQATSIPPHPLTIATSEVPSITPTTPVSVTKMPPLRKPESTHRKVSNPSTVFPSEASQDVRFHLSKGFASFPFNVNLPNQQVTSEPTIKTTNIIKSSRSKLNPNSPPEVGVDNEDKTPPVMPPKDQKLPLNVSHATGLLVLSVTSSYPGYVFTAVDRAKLVSCIPGVVIINTAKKGDSLILGVEPEELTNVFLDVEKELKSKNWAVSYVDTTNRDAFSYFGGWKLLPRVDKSGMFQLIVSLRSQGWRSKDSEVKKRNQLLDMVKDFNIAKIVHGEGETILLVGHVLECVAYSDCIRKVFSMERRHTWQPKPISIPSSDSQVGGEERHFWVKVKCPELSNLSTAHKQYSVFQQLSTAGKVLQLEHQLFGAVDNYMVVYSDMGATFPVLGQQFCLMELWPDSLPDIYNPTYGVDAWGFYSVSGKFPDNLSNEIRNKFAEDMKIVGAVGFRSGETEDSFSLHFVNSGCLEQISRCAQYTSFRLTILSSLIRKAQLDKKLRKMVPSILKYKELKLEKSNSQKIDVMKESELKTVEHVDEKKGKSVDEQRGKFVESQENKENLNQEAKEGLVKQPIMKESDIEELSKTKLPAAVNYKQSNETGHIKKERIVRDKKVNVGKMAGKKEKPKKITSQVEMSVDSAAAIDSIEQLSESELFKICWKEEGSIYSYLKNLRKFFDLVADVAVAECEKEVVLKFPSKKKLEDVLMIMSKDSTNSGEKLKLATKVVNLEGSKFFKNKFGLVLVEKKETIAQLKKDFAKFGQVEIEARSRVFVVWFDTKQGFFSALCDRSIGHAVFPSAQNFKFHKVLNTMERIFDLKVFNDSKTDVPLGELTTLDVVEVKSQLTEREIFGFIWQSPKGKIHIRDDQVISRQLTNFIKTVSCKNLSADEDGLLVSFSSQEDLSTALSQFSFTVPDKEQLSSMSRKFTLLPSRGFFGLFSAKRVKPDHFSKFGNCKVRNCGIWFSDKLAMFKVLRDPFIKKTYPALFIDCRNIFILSTNKVLPPVHSEKHVKPAASSALKTKPCQIKLTQFEGVMTRSATARLSSTPVTMEIASQVSKQDEIVPTHNDKSQAVTDHSNSRETAPADPAIVTAVAPPSIASHPPGPFCPLLSALLPVGKSALGQGMFGQVGKFGHIPCARLVRTGYKQSKMPARVKSGGEVDLFLKDSDCYRSKDIKEAAKLISNIVQGKMADVTGATLREIKMKRVEYFLKDQLGVDVVFANERKTNLNDDVVLDATRGVPINNPNGVNDELRENNVDGPTKDTSHESSINKYEVNDIIFDNLPEGAMQVRSTEEENCKIPREAGFDFNDLDSLTKEEIKIRKLKIDEERRKFEKEALIFPDEFLKDEELDFLPCIKDIDVEIPNIAEEKVTLIDQEIKMNPEESSQDLTSDLFGLYTLTLPVPRGSDLALLSNLQEDIAWFDTPVSVLCVDMIDEFGGAMLEVKMMDMNLTKAVLNGLKHKYPGLEGDITGQHADIVPAKETGLYTLCFTDANRKRYKATMDKFKGYSKQLPIISRGLGAEQVLVGFRVKEEAVEAFRQNMDCEEFPELHVASVSRS